MSNAIMTFENELLPAVGKRTGILHPDGSGYRTINLGGIGLLNSAGQFYESPQAVINLFNDSSNLQRRIRTGRLYAELGHPKPDGLNEEQFLLRVLSLYEEKEVAHIRKVELVNGVDDRGQSCLIMQGEVKPSGPHAAVLESKFMNGSEDTCFSIRCLTDIRREFGRVIKTITEIVTWDMVGEPGISIASKYRSPSTEAYAFSTETVLRAREELVRLDIGMEAGGAAEMLDRIIDYRTSSNRRKKAPPAMNW